MSSLHFILVCTIYIFKILEHDVALAQFNTEEADRIKDTSLPVYSKYIEIDHELVPRKIENINNMTALPVPDGRDSAMFKYLVSKRPIQEIIIEINDKHGSNDLDPSKDSRVSQSWKTESEIRQSKLKSALGTEGEITYDADWGFMSAILNAYNNHWVLRTGPEDWWTVVIRKIVQAMDENGNIPQVRNFFVEHEGKKKLQVNVGQTLSNINYNWLFSQFSDKVKADIKVPEFTNIIENDFSSSSDEQTMISNIMLMASMKNYYTYGIFTACGIPGVEMKGTEEDWVNLLDKINKLESLLKPINKHLGLTDWFKKTRIIFVNLLKTYRGIPNTEWWASILSWNERYSSGGICKYWSGWFPEFFGASDIPEGYLHFPSDLVTVPLHITDNVHSVPVEDDGILVAGIVGFNVKEGSRAPVVEAKHAWSLLMPADSPLNDRLTRG